MAREQTYIQKIVEQYGDLIFDLCESLLWSSNSAQIAFRKILKEIKQTPKAHLYSQHERAWVLKITMEKLTHFGKKHARRLSSSEQFMLDAALDVPSRLKRFDFYFHRLPMEDQALLLFQDKFKISAQETSAAMGISEDSLKTKRQLALRALDEWIWKTV